ncbi:hypothetical protein JCM10212_003993 [Sporobolomyces blumeae]
MSHPVTSTRRQGRHFVGLTKARRTSIPTSRFVGRSGKQRWPYHTSFGSSDDDEDDDDETDGTYTDEGADEGGGVSSEASVGLGPGRVARRWDGLEESIGDLELQHEIERFTGFLASNPLTHASRRHDLKFQNALEPGVDNISSLLSQIEQASTNAIETTLDKLIQSLRKHQDELAQVKATLSNAARSTRQAQLYSLVAEMSELHQATISNREATSNDLRQIYDSAQIELDSLASRYATDSNQVVAKFKVACKPASSATARAISGGGGRERGRAGPSSTKTRSKQHKSSSSGVGKNQLEGGGGGGGGGKAKGKGATVAGTKPSDLTGGAKGRGTKRRIPHDDDGADYEDDEIEDD